MKTWLVFLVDCNRQTNKGRNWDITQSFLALALKNLSREELSAVRSVFFAM
ncbi:hypothetical protein [Desulfoferrobacter suflitae]|uniref:hypothetical protein n=1 Tax=Desulfoferrobacter suflitae TaxID=2865782 RepID=UPI002164B670|nr:hypothetical protein [Desulfoferrobacter suflitae]MCK8603535.1 hypothetical protein [Desulfoferrobacter suflitae]